MYRRMEMELAQQRNLAQYQRQNDLEDHPLPTGSHRELPDVQQDSAFSAWAGDDAKPSCAAAGVPPDERPTNHNQRLKCFDEYDPQKTRLRKAKQIYSCRKSLRRLLGRL